MTFPIKTCVICSEEFELKPGKPGFANQCPSCSSEAMAEPAKKRATDSVQRQTDKEANETRRTAMRDLLYRKDS